MIKGIIMDMDGTLTDSMCKWFDLGENYIRSQGYEVFDEKTNDVFLSSTREGAAEYFKKVYKMDKSVQEIVDDMNGIMYDFYKNEVELKPCVIEMLQGICDREIRMVLATNTYRRLTEAAFKRTGLDKYIDKIITCSEIGTSKRDPAIFHACMDYLGTGKDETCVFEDAYFAIKTARAEGLGIVAFKDAAEPEQEEIKKLSDVYVDDYHNMTEVWKFLDRGRN